MTSDKNLFTGEKGQKKIEGHKDATSPVKTNAFGNDITFAQEKVNSVFLRKILILFHFVIYSSLIYRKFHPLLH
jgi:hypothetical protein